MAQDVVADMVGRLGFQVEDEGLAKFTKGMDDAKRSSDGMGARAVALGGVLSDLASKAASTAIDLAKTAYAMGKGLAQDVAHSSVEIDRLAKRLGVTRREIQELGGEASGAPKALEKLQEGLGELALRGSGPAKESLGALGLTLRDLEGQGPADQLRTIADAMRDLPSDAERTKVALELLGEEGAALLPELSQGAGGIDALIQRTKDLGVILDDQAIDAGKDYARSMKELDAVWARAAATAGTALAPVFTDLTRGAAEWLQENEQVIAQDLPAFIERVVEVGGAAIEWAVAFADDVSYLATETERLAVSVEETLVEAYEIAKPVIDAVTTVIEYQVAAIGIAVDGIEAVVGRLEVVRSLAAEIQTGLGLDDTPTTDVRGSGGLAAENAARRAALGQAEPGAGFDVNASAAEIERRAADPSENPTVRRQAREALPGAVQREAEAAALEAAQAFADGAKAYETRRDRVARDAASAQRRRRAEKYRDDTLNPSKGGGGAVDTRAAERLLGADIDALAAASGASAKARRAAIEAAAGELAGGAGESVARQAAAGVLTSKTGVDLANQGGPEAALFGQLTAIGGADAARSATDGAKFVTIDQSVTVNVGGIALEIPESYTAALSEQGFAGGVEAALQRALADRVFGPIVDAQAGRSVRP